MRDPGNGVLFKVSMSPKFGMQWNHTLHADQQSYNEFPHEG